MLQGVTRGGGGGVKNYPKKCYTIFEWFLAHLNAHGYECVWRHDLHIFADYIEIQKSVLK